MSLVTNLQDAFTRVGTEFKAVRTTIGSLASLTTTTKTSVVDAINEVNAKPSGTGGASINDAAPSTTTTYSGTKIESAVSAATAALVNGAPAALDTLKELADALAADDTDINAINTALGNRVRVDAVQSFTSPQQAQARSNIGAGTSSLVIGTTSGTAADAAALATSLSGKANTVHTHAGADVTQASETLRGTVEMATTAEAAAGTDTARAVTPAGLVAFQSATVGSTSTNFVTTFEAALV